MKKISVSFLFVVLIGLATKTTAQDSTKRWSEKKAWDWYNKQPLASPQPLSEGEGRD